MYDSVHFFYLFIYLSFSLVNAYVDWGGSVMDFTYPLTRCMSQHMPILGLLGLNGDSLVFLLLSVTLSILHTNTRILWNIVE